jgi:MFS transporter, AAHS family, 4-hydroxybenzoate transporter
MLPPPAQIPAADTAAGAPEVRISTLLDECGLSRFHIKLIVWSVLIALIDGYDLAVTAYVAPHLVTDWGVPRGSLGPVLSASGFGVLVGSQIFGWLGDRYGRKTALIAANLLFGLFTFAAAYSANLTELFWLRVIAGIGIGGVIPNMVALNAEWRRAACAPRWPSSLWAWCRSAALLAASSARPSSADTAGRFCL